MILALELTRFFPRRTSSEKAQQFQEWSCYYIVLALILYTYRIFVCLFMFCPVRRIWEFFGAVELLSIFAIKRLVSSVRSHMNFAVLRARKRAVAIFVLKRKSNFYISFRKLSETWLRGYKEVTLWILTLFFEGKARVNDTQYFNL